MLNAQTAASEGEHEIVHERVMPGVFVGKLP